jgi:hypothetical protein
VGQRCRVSVPGYRVPAYRYRPNRYRLSAPDDELGAKTCLEGMQSDPTPSRAENWKGTTGHPGRPTRSYSKSVLLNEDFEVWLVLSLSIGGMRGDEGAPISSSSEAQPLDNIIFTRHRDSLLAALIEQLEAKGREG